MIDQNKLLLWKKMYSSVTIVIYYFALSDVAYVQVAFLRVYDTTVHDDQSAVAFALSFL